MTSRPAKPADVPRLLEIEQGASTAAHWREEDYAAIFEAGRARRVMLVAEERKNVLGFIVALIATDEWEIENVVIAPEAQRRRLASRMMDRLLDLATGRGAISVMLEVRESNVAARGLYANAGFVEVGRRPRYYSSPVEDAVLYRLTLR